MSPKCLGMKMEKCSLELSQKKIFWFRLLFKYNKKKNRKNKIKLKKLSLLKIKNCINNVMFFLQILKLFQKYR